jgi:hypothetical protein
MWQMADQMGHNVTRETRDYLDRLLQIAVDSIDTQFPRIRKEYRMMSDAERDRFHKAILALKEDTVKDKLYFIYFQSKSKRPFKYFTLLFYFTMFKMDADMDVDRYYIFQICIGYRNIWQNIS